MKNSFSKINIDKMYGLSLLSSTVLESFKKQQGQINSLIKPLIMKSMLNQQNQLSKIFNASGFDAIKKQQEQLSCMFNTSIIEAIKKQHIQTNRLFSSSALSALRNERINANKLLVSPIFDSLIKEQNKFNDIFKASIINSIKIAPNILSEISSISSVVKKFQRMSIYPAMIKEMEQSFSFGLIQKLNKENITLDETIGLVQNSFSEKLENTPQGLITFEGMVQILFAIILCIYAQASALESDKNISRKIENLEIHIMGKISQLLPSNTAMAVYYIVKRAVNLRADNNTKSTVISMLYPNQRVELIKRERKWIYVKYFDHINGTQRMGWIYKKYLKMEK